MFKFKNIWMGPEANVFNEGFDDLFKVEDNYKIPTPSKESKVKLGSMVAEKPSARPDSFENAMDNVFGSKKECFNKVNSNYVPPLQAVQSINQPVNNIVVVEPRTFEDSLEIVNYLKERKSVIVNLQYLDREVSQRVIDFVSGATLSLDGTQERVGHGVFIFASINCQVETESDSVRAYKDLFAKTFG